MGSFSADAEFGQMVLLARLDEGSPESDRRLSKRQTLRLELPSSSPSATGLPVCVHNISRSGLLIESDVELEVGVHLDIDLPEIGLQTATVVWRRDGFFGCEFQTPLSNAGLSAALLKSYATGETGVDTHFSEDAEDHLGDGFAKPPFPARLGIILGLAVAAWALLIAIYMLVR